MSLLTHSGDSLFTSKPRCLAAIDVNIIRGPGTINKASQLQLRFCFFSSQEAAAEAVLAPSFRNIVQNMEDYLSPLLTQLDFSFSR